MAKEIIPVFKGIAYYTPADQERVYKQFTRFVTNGYQFKHFPKTLYHRLMNMFGFIAHYNQFGFYEEYFLTDSGKAEFYNAILNPWTPNLDELELAIQSWLQEFVQTKKG